MRKETFRRNLSLLVTLIFLLASTGPSVFAAIAKITVSGKPEYTAGQTEKDTPKKISLAITVPDGTTTPQAIDVSITGSAVGKFFLAADATTGSATHTITRQYNVPTSSGVNWNATAYLGILKGQTLVAGDTIKVTIKDANSKLSEFFHITVKSKGGGGGGGGGGGHPVKPPVKPDDKPKKPTTPEKPGAGTGEQSRFNDVKSTDWFFGDVEYVVKNGFFTGVSANTFGPRTPMTRGMIVTVLGRIGGADTSAYTSSSFNDVAMGQYYAAYVEWAKSNGIVKGIGAGSFAPDMEVSRQDFAVILLRYAEFAKKTLPSVRQPILFSDDTKIAGYAKNAVQTLYGSAIVHGVGKNTFSPIKSATRAEVAAMLHRFVEATKK